MLKPKTLGSRCEPQRSCDAANFRDVLGGGNPQRSRGRLHITQLKWVSIVRRLKGWQSCMKQIQFTFLLLAFLVFGVANSASADTGATQRHLDLLSNFVLRMCGNLPLYSDQRSGRVSAEANAEFSKLLRTLARIGIKGNVDAQFGIFHGVAQKDLPTALHDIETCRISLVHDLKDVVFPRPPPPPPPPATASRAADTNTNPPPPKPCEGLWCLPLKYKVCQLDPQTHPVPPPAIGPMSCITRENLDSTNVGAPCTCGLRGPDGLYNTGRVGLSRIPSPPMPGSN
jgi:hypothetical protein